MMVYLSCFFLKIVLKRQQIRVILSLFDRIHRHATHFINPSKDHMNMPYYLGKKTNSFVKKTAFRVVYSIDSEQNHFMNS